MTVHNLNDMHQWEWRDICIILLSRCNQRMSEPPQELIARLKGLVAQAMRETDPQKYDELASELWLVLEQIDQHRTATPKKVA